MLTGSPTAAPRSSSPSRNSPPAGARRPSISGDAVDRAEQALEPAQDIVRQGRRLDRGEVGFQVGDIAGAGEDHIGPRLVAAEAVGGFDQRANARRLAKKAERVGPVYPSRVEFPAGDESV